jgi:hypothetical protein
MPGKFWQGIAFYESSGYGFSSVWYPIATDYPTALNLTQLANTKEMGLRSSQVTCIGVRVSDMEVRNDSGISDPVTPKGTWVPTAPDVDLVFDPNYAVRILMGSANLHRLTKFIRGVPAPLCNPIGRVSFTPDQTWGANSVLYETQMKTGYNIVHRVKGQPGVFLAFPIDFVQHHFVSADIRMQIRKAGRPFDLPRGRQKAG